MCRSRAIRLAALTAAHFDSEARCNSCGGAVRAGHGRVVAGILITALIFSVFWVGWLLPLIGMVLVALAAILLGPIRPDRLDSINTGREFKERIARRKRKGDA